MVDYSYIIETFVGWVLVILPILFELARLSACLLQNICSDCLDIMPKDKSRIATNISGVIRENFINKEAIHHFATYKRRFLLYGKYALVEHVMVFKYPK